MVSKITNGVKVLVETQYHNECSDSEQYFHLFIYQITIQNECKYSIQLLDRHWLVYDAGYYFSEIKGEGVLGRQPILESGQSHHYSSRCMLKSGIGKMIGIYKMKREIDSSTFIVNIPEFSLICPFLLN